jgi:hypothetical protein
VTSLKTQMRMMLQKTFILLRSAGSNVLMTANGQSGPHGVHVQEIVQMKATVGLRLDRETSWYPVWRDLCLCLGEFFGNQDLQTFCMLHI